MPVKSAGWAKALKEPHPYKVTYGGRAGGKSTEYSLALVQLSAREPVRICCARAFKNSIGESSKAALVGRIKELGYEHLFKVTEDGIDGIYSGSHIFFQGWLRNVQSVRSLEDIHILWVDEAQYMTQLAWDEIDPTMRRPGVEVWITFNPQSSTDVVWQEFCTGDPPKGTFLHKVNYTENPFVSQETIDRAERAKRRNVERYNHLWLGELADTSEDARRVVPLRYIEHTILKEEITSVFEMPEYNWTYDWTKEPRRAGFDPADEGEDLSGFAIRQGPVTLFLAAFEGDVDEVCPIIYQLCKEWQVSDLWYDGVGIGTGVRDRFKNNMPCRTVTGVNFGKPVHGKGVRFDGKLKNGEVFQYINSQMYWNLRLRTEQRRMDAMNPTMLVDPRKQLYIQPGLVDENLKMQLAQPEWRISPTGHTRVEKKPRGSNKSPDIFDAWALSYYYDIRNGIKVGGSHLVKDGTDLALVAQKKGLEASV